MITRLVEKREKVHFLHDRMEETLFPFLGLTDDLQSFLFYPIPHDPKKSGYKSLFFVASP